MSSGSGNGFIQRRSSITNVSDETRQKSAIVLTKPSTKATVKPPRLLPTGIPCPGVSDYHSCNQMRTDALHLKPLRLMLFECGDMLTCPRVCSWGDMSPAIECLQKKADGSYSKKADGVAQRHGGRPDPLASRDCENHRIGAEAQSTCSSSVPPRLRVSAVQKPEES